MKHFLSPVFLLVLVAGTLLFAGPASSQESTSGPDIAENPITRKLSIGLAGGLMRFDTNFKFTSRDTGRSVFIDSESSLGLPENKTIPAVFGYWRPSMRHGLGFTYFSVRRESELLVFDENYEDLNITGTALLRDDSKFYGLTYNYTLFQDDRAFLFASLGLNAIDLEYTFDARGTISIGDEPIDSGVYTESLRQFSPFPLIGLDSWFLLTQRWAFGARVAFVGGEFGNVKALITEANIRAKYAINPNVGLIMGVRFFDADVDITSSSKITEITYGLDGLLIGIDVGF